MNIGALQDNYFGYWLNGKVPGKIERFSNDTRTLQPGDCFVAYSFSRRDGHVFIKDAKEKHASCALVSTPNMTVDLPQFICPDTRETMAKIANFSRSIFRGKMVAITGSFGKTTTKDLLKSLLDLKKNVTYGNMNGQLGVPLTLATVTNNEPYAVVEIGIDTPGEIENLIALTSPNIAIVTGISKIHMSAMGSEEKIAEEKAKLILKTIENGGQGIFSEDCLRFEIFRKIREKCIVPQKNDENFGYKINTTATGHEVSLNFNGEIFHFHLPNLMSSGIAKNFILACSCALMCGINPDVIRKKISHWQPSKLRGELISKGNKIYFADCYNSNPASLLDSLKHFDRLIPQNNRLFVLGMLKDEEIGPTAAQEKIFIVKKIPIREGDQVILIGEDAEKYANQIACKKVHTFASTQEALPIIEKFSGTVFLKGHRCYALENLVI